MRVIAGLCALVLCLIAPAAAGARGLPDSASADSKLERALADTVALPDGPEGGAALIQRGNRVEFIRVGTGDLRTGRAIHRSDHMRIASVAKAFSGAVGLSLVDQGLVRLDDTLGELLPTSTPVAWSQVTLAQLMQHRSGVPSYTTSPGLQEAFGADPRGYLTPQQLIDFVADQPLEFTPGSIYRYSNTDNILIGLIAEATTGHRYQNDLRQLVYRPLGLKQTSLPTDWLIPRRFIHGYDDVLPEDGGPPEDLSEVLSVSGVWASGGIISTPAELNKFIRGYVGGELFGSRVRSRQFEFVPGCGEPAGPGECSAGLSLYRYRTDCGTVFGHSGNFPGYTQLTASTRNGRNSMVVTFNQAQDGLPEPNPVFERMFRTYEAAACAVFAKRG